jgi:hypothetical protein
MGRRRSGRRLEPGAHLGSGCHIVDTSGEETDAAPSFQSIAQDRSKDQAWLRAWLVAPHPRMPDLNLSRDEIDDIIAYLSSLEKP